MKKKVLVLGGGASGLGVAWKLAENNIPVELIELKNEIGGLAATVRKDGYYLDYGPHYFLSEKPEIIPGAATFPGTKVPFTPIVCLTSVLSRRVVLPLTTMIVSKQI